MPFFYRLHENDFTGADPLLVEAGGDRITWERAFRGRFRSCGEVLGLTAELCHHLLAEMLGEPDAAMPWRAQKDVTLYEESNEQIARAIGIAILGEQAILLKSVQEFRDKGLITAEEAKVALPKLSVTIRHEDSPARPE